MSTGDHHGRKTTFVLFINGRPVDCGPLRRALEATYATVLPKAQKPWVYLVRREFSMCMFHARSKWVANLCETKRTIDCAAYLHAHMVLIFVKEKMNMYIKYVVSLWGLSQTNHRHSSCRHTM